MFQRVDRNQDSFVTSLEILNFLRDNGVHSVTEADCYYLVKFFDSDEDGRLSYPDFMQLVLPCDNASLRAAATQRPNQLITSSDYLTLDVERDLTKLIMAEIELHRKAERLKQQLESSPDYSEEAVYGVVDDWGYGFVDTRNIKSFFRNNKYKATDEDCVAIIRRMDLDADSKLTKEEFLSGVRAQEPYSKMIVREQMAKKEQLKRIKSQNQSDLQKGRRVNKKAEEGQEENAVRVQALDRSYKEVLSSSPLKMRVQLDLYGDPQRGSPQSHQKSRNDRNTPLKAGPLLKSAQKASPNQGNPLKASQSKSMFRSTNGFEQSTFASPSKFRSSGASEFKTPARP